MDLKILPAYLPSLSNVMMELNLKDNRLENKTFAMLKEFPALSALDLGGNNLAEIPREVFELSNLEALHLQNNQIQSLDIPIGKLKNLKKLSAQNNSIAKIVPCSSERALCEVTNFFCL